jgi:hypothetical protein
LAPPSAVCTQRLAPEVPLAPVAHPPQPSRACRRLALAFPATCFVLDNRPTGLSGKARSSWSQRRIVQPLFGVCLAPGPPTLIQGALAFRAMYTG